ncbi:MAG: NUDIX domain-containing protein [Candidatus Peribacteria bacterium]|nr:NUDIX domain-containing protein [Candidatus Peribacteria bacterium]
MTRGQPFHKGHLDAIQQAVEQGITKVLIGVGSSNKEFTSDNPLTYEERKNIIEMMTTNLLQTIQIEVFPVPDVGDNTRWREYLLKELPDFHYLISGNARVQEIFKDTDKEIIPLSIREFVKGSTIREQLARGNMEKVKADLSEDAVVYLESIHAHERLKEIFNKERKVPGLTADIVLFDQDGKLILIERKNYPKGVALPGGFVEKGEPIKKAAKREAKEEI